MPRRPKTTALSTFFWFLTPNRTQADMGRIQRYGTRIWRSEMPIDRLGPGVACMGRIVHVRGVHATHTPAQHTPKCTTKVTCPLCLYNPPLGRLMNPPMQHYTVIDVYMSKLCSLVMFGVIKCPLCGSAGPGVTDRALTLTETDIEPLLEIRWS